MRKAAVITAILLAFGVLYAVGPEREPFMPRCLFHWLTGLDCPACGSQRALHQLFHLHVREALAYNPFLVVSLPYLGALALCRWFNDGGRLDRLKSMCHHPAVIRLYLVLLIAWWVARNLV